MQTGASGDSGDQEESDRIRRWREGMLTLDENVLGLLSELLLPFTVVSSDVRAESCWLLLGRVGESEENSRGVPDGFAQVDMLGLVRQPSLALVSKPILVSYRREASSSEEFIEAMVASGGNVGRLRGPRDTGVLQAESKEKFLSTVSWTAF